MRNTQKILTAAIMAGCGSLQAATFTVSDPGDNGPGTLRQALIDAAANTEVDTINFTAAFVTPTTITLSSGPLQVTEANGVTIEPGLATGAITVTQTGGQQLVNVTGAGTVTISSLTFSGGIAPSGGAFQVSADSDLTLSGVTVSGNTATGAADGGGGIFNEGVLTLGSGTTIINNAATGTSGSGGGVFSRGGSLTLDGAIFTNNIAERAGGGVEIDSNGAFSSLSTDFTGNVAGDGAPNPGNGGAIHITGGGGVTTSIVGGTFSGNSAAAEGGALWNGAGEMTFNGVTVMNNTASGAGDDQGGGGIFNAGGVLTIYSSTASIITGNVADGAAGSGGGILLDGGSATIDGATISSNVANRAGGGLELNARIDQTASVNLANVTLDNNALPTASAAPGNGGGLHVSGPGTVDITGGTASGNTAAAEGGGLWNGSGTMTISGTTIVGNVASGAADNEGGGGIFNAGGALVINTSSGAVTIESNVADGTSGNGGGIMIDGGSASLDGATVQLNQANRAGAGIELNARVDTSASVIIANSSLSGNVTPTGTAAPGNGGALHVSGQGTVNIDGSSITSNTAAAEGGGLWNGSGTMTITTSSILDNDALGDGDDQGGGGIFNSGGALVIGNAPVTRRSKGVLPVQITGNRATGTSGSGGGILIDGGSAMIVDANISQNDANRAGGGIELNARVDTAASLTMSGGTLGSNTTPAVSANPGNGGGLHVSGPGSVQISATAVTNNVAAAEGGGLWNGSGPMTVTGGTISANVASGVVADSSAPEDFQGGGGIFNAGGALSVESGTQITGNMADGVGGAGNVSSSGGGIMSVGGSVSLTNDVVLSGNTALRAGGGIELVNSGFTGNGITLTTNDAGGAAPQPGNGGGLHITGTSSADLTNIVVTQNVAAAEGGGLWNGGGTMTIANALIDGNSAGGDASDQGGGGVFNAGGAIVIDEVSGSPSTISNNSALGASGSGGGLLSDGGSISIGDTLFDTNTANRAGGGIEMTAGASGTLAGTLFTGNDTGVTGTPAPGNGGALHVAGGGLLTANGVDAQNNVAANEGGGFWNGGGAETNVSNASFSGNRSNGLASGGGAFLNLATASIANSTFTANTAASDGPGDGGGAVFNTGTLTIVDSDFSDNLATDTLGNGGAILNTETGALSVVGGSFVGNEAARAGGMIENIGDAGLSGFSASQNIAGINGGVLHITGAGRVSISDAVMTSNSAVNEGGGLWVSAGGELTVMRSRLGFNQADFGGALFADGGDLSVTDNPNQLRVIQSVAYNNDATTEGGALSAEIGTTSVINSTFSGNSAASGGAINALADATIQLSSSTVARNSADVGGGVANALGGSVSAQDSLIAENIAATGPNLSGNLVSEDFLVLGPTTDGTVSGPVDNSILNVIDARLSGLADNGGDTLTHALLPGSPAIDAGSTECPPMDQRTFGRTGLCDIGAYEDLADPELLFKDGFETLILMP